MSIQIPNRPFFFIVTTTSERDTKWHDGSLVYVTDDNMLYILDSGTWKQVGSYPRRLNQANIPANGTGATQINVGELLIWRDTDDSKIYLVYNDTDSGVKSIELI